ncbi:MAG TPA: FAD:protein FMN transferase [Gammaproteobacteria bacterium]|nr:FAD:protein FMN transferase [Gammaproteobacteria bacterium]
MNSRRMRPLLGTFVEIGARIGAGGGAAANAAITAAFAGIETIQRLLSFHDPDSDLSRLNRRPGDEIELHPLSLRVLRLARCFTRASGGLFNCTVGGALVRLGRLPDHGGPPPLDFGIADDIEIFPERGSARLRRPLRITLDGIAKGYAVDHGVLILRRHGADSGWINAGGDLRVFGDMKLPVRRPEPDGGFTSFGELQLTALATSRVQNIPDDRFPGFIVAAGSDAPPKGVWSVLAAQAWRADALTKVAALAQDAAREALLNRLGGRLCPVQLL